MRFTQTILRENLVDSSCAARCDQILSQKNTAVGSHISLARTSLTLLEDETQREEGWSL